MHFTVVPQIAEHVMMKCFPKKGTRNRTQTPQVLKPRQTPQETTRVVMGEWTEGRRGGEVMEVGGREGGGGEEEGGEGGGRGGRREGGDKQGMIVGRGSRES